MDKQNKIRYFVLSFFLVLFTIFSLRHFVLGGGVAASVDALCPFGGFETLFTFIATGGFVPRILISSLILALGVLLTVIIFRKGFCGYICPFGFIQELFFKLNKRVIKVNKELDKVGRFAKYYLLFAILLGTYLSGTLVFRNYDPFMTFFHFGKGIFWDYNSSEFISHLIPFTILIIILSLSIFIERFWCKYLCPLTATMNLFTFFGFTKIHRNKTCIDCKICDKVCPMGVKVSTVDYIKDVECINCNKCISKCPKNSLSNKFIGKTLTTTTYIFLLLALFILVIGSSKAIGVWQSVPTSSLSNVGGNLDANNIKGWMTLQQVSEETKIHLPHFIQDFNLPNDFDVNTPLKDISKKYNLDFETEDLREYVRNFRHSSVHEEGPECPWGIVDDHAPGKCGLYVDKDNNDICDLSE